MNYAEDRLDRRARSSHSSQTETTQGQLACDLTRAHDVFSLHNRTDTDLWRSASALDCTSATIQSIRDLREAHELAGKTLRDEGRNRQSVFHFGMAWKICHWLVKNSKASCYNVTLKEEEANSVGHYAQICEFSGFPEIGALALLFYRAGGNLEFGLESIASSSSTVTTCGDDSNHDDDGATQEKEGCGCGMTGCGASPCFVVFPCSSPIVKRIMNALDELSIDPRDTFPQASEILAQLAHMSRKSNVIGNPLAAMHAFLSERHVMEEIPSILRYWDDGNIDLPQPETIGNRDDQCCTSNNQHTQPDQFERRALPPAILLLLLKLLYSSPVSGAFLQLACLSTPFLAARFAPASGDGKMLARHFKSHWAYYIFIRYLVLGERVKKHKRGKVKHHMQVWNLVFGLEPPKCTDSNANEENEEDCGFTTGDKNKISDYCRNILQTCCSQYMQPILACEKSSIPSFQMPNPSLPHITQHSILSCSARPIFFVGDSHVLSLAWQTLCINQPKAKRIDSDLLNIPEQKPILRTAIPFPATGMKAWHVRPSTQFFTHYNLHACLQRLPSSSSRTIILSAGEIDCREGIGGSLLQGYYRNCGDAIERTVIEYLTSLTAIAKKYQIQILVMPVAPHAYRSEKNGKSVGRARRRETMCLWNEILRRELACERGLNQLTRVCSRYDRVFLLDYERKLQHADTNSPVGYVLHPSYNADYTHVNSAILPLVEDAILECGCQLSLL